jgi:hypothetical protein
MTAQADTERTIDRTTDYPGVPPAVADLWSGWGYSGGTDAQSVETVLAGVTSIVNAMAGGDHYAVMLSGQVSTAGTDLQAKRVGITTAALVDQRLTLLERLGVTTAMGVHEAGHTRISAPMGRAVAKAFRAESRVVYERAQTLSNIGDDERLEYQTSQRWPTYTGLFSLGAWWITQRYPRGMVTRAPQTRQEALNLGLAAIRYLRWTQWGSDPLMLAERAWWRAWGDRMKVADKPKDHVALIREALDHIEPLPEERPEPGEQSQPGQSGQSEDDSDLDQPDPSAPSDEPGEQEPGSAGAAEADEADGEADGEAQQQGEPDGEPAGQSSTESSAEPNADGDGRYTHADEARDADAEALAADAEVTSSTYGPNRGDGADGTPVMEGAAQDRNDALTSPLPLEAHDALTNDDRNRDLNVARNLNTRATAVNKQEITVTHREGAKAHKVRVKVIPVEKKGSKPNTSPEVQAALRAAFTSRRTSHDNRTVARSGRVSGHRVYRVAAGFDTVFTRREALSPDRLDLHLLVDASGSMAARAWNEWDAPRLVEVAGTLTANIAEALQRVPGIRVHIWAHNYSWNGTALWDVYDGRRGDKINRVRAIDASGGNNDASAIRALGEVIRRERSPRERSVMVVLSDGAPNEDESWVRGAVESVRKDGIGVISVAIDGGLTETQNECYLPEYVVPWEGDWDLLGRKMAKIMGRLA